MVRIMLKSMLFISMFSGIYGCGTMVPHSGTGLFELRAKIVDSSCNFSIKEGSQIKRIAVYIISVGEKPCVNYPPYYDGCYFLASRRAFRPGDIFQGYAIFGGKSWNQGLSATCNGELMHLPYYKDNF